MGGGVCIAGFFLVGMYVHVISNSFRNEIQSGRYFDMLPVNDQPSVNLSYATCNPWFRLLLDMFSRRRYSQTLRIRILSRLFAILLEESVLTSGSDSEGFGE